MNLKVRLAVMNFLEFAVWGSLSYVYGQLSRQGWDGCRDFLVLYHTGNRIYFYAYIDGHCGR